MKTKHILYPFLAIFFCFSGWSCSSPPWEPSPITHPFLIGTEECRPPCWEGIRTGETTFLEALDLVRDLEFVSDEGRLDYGYKTHIHWYRGDSNNVSITFFEDKVIYIRLDFVGIDFGSVVNHFGEPDGYNFGIEHGWYWMGVFYPNLGIVFYSWQENAQISKNMPVVQAYFLYPADEENFPTIFHFNRSLIGPPPPEYDYYHWQGFGVNLGEQD